jgi:excisionase family DNA binding protein
LVRVEEGHAIARSGESRAGELVGRFRRLTVINSESYFSAHRSMSTIPTYIPTHPQLTREDVLDGRDVAELLHLPLSTVLEYARRGLLPARKLGRRWIFLRDEIEAAVRGGKGSVRKEP